MGDPIPELLLSLQACSPALHCSWDLEEEGRAPAWEQGGEE